MDVDRLVEENMVLAKEAVAKYRNLDSAEVFSVAQAALLKAARTAPSDIINFRAYAAQAVDWAVLDYAKTLKARKRDNLSLDASENAEGFHSIIDSGNISPADEMVDRDKTHELRRKTMGVFEGLSKTDQDVILASYGLEVLSCTFCYEKPVERVGHQYRCHTCGRQFELAYKVVAYRVQLPSLKCKHCGYQWEPRVPKKPKKCPYCFATNWSKEPKWRVQSRAGLG